MAPSRNLNASQFIFLSRQFWEPVEWFRTMGHLGTAYWTSFSTEFSLLFIIERFMKNGPFGRNKIVQFRELRHQHIPIGESYWNEKFTGLSISLHFFGVILITNLLATFVSRLFLISQLTVTFLVDLPSLSSLLSDSSGSIISTFAKSTISRSVNQIIANSIHV